MQDLIAKCLYRKLIETSSYPSQYSLQRNKNEMYCNIRQYLNLRNPLFATLIETTEIFLLYL